MSEEILFDCLHAEIVNYCLDSNKEHDLATLEYIGFTTGYRLIERLTREVARFKDELETMKFICTDFWTLIYKKQVDNLRTNNHGMYVVQDKAFRFLTRISPGTKQLEHAPKFVAFTCGLVRGALSNLGINSTVTAEVQSIPACKFHIEVNRS
ncbi:GL13756 [Drosophila persimilis]|uniref:Trafficking protein particle complex subunit 6B n=4 Tax=obscura group TaxID=32355 RepID=A0A6I8UMM4_DROPS|nr:trafficking protein particle complex subunit 6b [Drosophila pseudoobscura]XP_002020013.1 trafficking protein particle complex subunit 6b [Drosophila persimilis]XP_034128296.1 trafficking protein particle complex subunit 6b [Drosophila guanche]XP_034664317.1 trafficking protein particle complex subunit 6b [Drosophila subobscura]EDW38825.1 GL13756 [Drosophila persimilis]SPP80739.1 blast:Trafficking protein particle complex subunit 6B [Drosophila guanche]